ncbi:uncharacterized protein LOC126819445 [Patella vulgata]|uniref:uncharacterized protein LOC126819445 n=1 Tax=Patella vulgata TaxID=6465 RepID=UPI00218088CE|nr:uncharacterized protein LOC126819445 [Patella vulgata]
MSAPVYCQNLSKCILNFSLNRTICSKLKSPSSKLRSIQWRQGLEKTNVRFFNNDMSKNLSSARPKYLITKSVKSKPISTCSYSFYAKHKQFQSYCPFSAIHINRFSTSIKNLSEENEKGGKEIEKQGKEEEKQPEGKIITVVNPFSLLLLKYNVYRLRQIDPSFNMDEFLVGVKQAVTLVSQYISRKDYSSLEGLVRPQVIKWLQRECSEWTDEQYNDIELETKNIQFLQSNGMTIEEGKKGNFLVTIKTCTIGVKMSNKLLCVVEIASNFCRNYKDDQAGDWILDKITGIKIKKAKDDKPVPF